MKERIIYRNFNIDKTDSGYRISKCDNPEMHTHLRNKSPAFRLIDNVLANRIPRRCKTYYLQSHIRLSDNPEYIRHIEDYINVKQNKSKQYYYNPSRKKSGGIF